MNMLKSSHLPSYLLFGRIGLLTALLTAGCISTGVTAQGSDKPGDSAMSNRKAPEILRYAQNDGNRQSAIGNRQSAFRPDPDVPTPQSAIGHPVGERAVRYDALVRYLKTLAAASPLVMLTPYAESHEGRTLYYLTITSRANHDRLDQIKSDNARLADPRTLAGPEEGDRLAAELPGIAWLAYAIHGDELSSTDAAMQVAYQLAAGTDDATRELRDQLVIHIDPLMNPDGRERYLAQLQQLTGQVANTDHQALQHTGVWSAGRGNHYLFDLNRDWLMQVHPETRGRARAIQSWNPHLVVDSHEMGSLDTYLFDPPREPLSPHLSDKLLEWRRRFSADQARAFDRHGWSYYTREWYEEWYPGYTNAWTSLLGAAGLLYEQASVNAAAVKQATGRTLTYQEAVHHHVVSSMANLATLRENRAAILADFLADRQWAVSDQGPYIETLLLPPQADVAKHNRFVDLLQRQGIEYRAAAAPFTAGGVVDVWGEKTDTRSFPARTLIVRSRQPHRRLLHAILDFDPHTSDTFLNQERKDLENHRGTRVYDITAWNIPMAYGLEAYWADDVTDVPISTPAPPPQPDPAAIGDKPAYGWLIDGAGADVHRALVRLFDHDCKPRVASKPFRIADRNYKPGSLLLRRHENPDRLPDVLREIVAESHIDVRPVDTALSQKGPDLGGPRFHLLQPPRVAVASQWPISTTSFGSTWYLLDQRIGLRVSPVNVQNLSFIDLRKYNVLVLPNTWSTGRLAAVLDKSGVEKIKTWVQAGGTLIALGNAAAFVAEKDRGLSSVRFKRDVLDELPAYAEALEREKSARRIDVDPDIVWGTQGPEKDSETGEPGPSTDKSDSKKESKQDKETRRRKDQWLRIFSPRGAILGASLDPEHWLCFGLGERLPVLFSGSRAYMSKPPVATPVRLLDEEHLRLSGLVWPEARRRSAETAYATVERVGSGQIILFANDPFFRAYFEGTGRLLLNAIVLGPGMGTSIPLPW